MKTLFIIFFVGVSCLLFACNLQMSRNQVEKEKEAVSFKRDSAEVYKNLGVSPFELGELDKFPVELGETIQVKPRAKIYRNIGASYLEQGKVDEAVLAFRKAIQIDPSFVEAHYLLADVYSIKGEGVLSRQFLDQAMALEGSYIIDISSGIMDRTHTIIESTPPTVIRSEEVIELPPEFFEDPAKMGVPRKWESPPK